MDTTTYLSRISDRKIKVGIVGLGYVGLPLMLNFVQKGFSVVGFDIDKRKIDTLAHGHSYIRHISEIDIDNCIRSEKFHPTWEFEHIAACDAVLLCVPTPLNRNREPEMKYIVDTAKSIAPYLHAHTLIVLESTTYPGTTDTLLRNELEKTNTKIKLGETYWLAFSPEREDPGNKSFKTKEIPKIVGGMTPDCATVATALYTAVLDKVITVSSTRVAEMTKLLENIFRSVNIALVNELKMLCEKMEIDIWEVVEAASTKPFGFMPFYPGPGLGGHCIPVDPFYLTWKAREFGQVTRFIELAGEINTSMHHYVNERLNHALNLQKKSINGSKILVMGIAYKKNVDDMRESPALQIIEKLQQQGADVSYHDPFIPHLRTTRKYCFDMKSIVFTKEKVAGFDAALIVTDHSNVSYGDLVAWVPLVIDTRNATRNVTEGREKIYRA